MALVFYKQLPIGRKSVYFVSSSNPNYVIGQSAIDENLLTLSCPIPSKYWLKKYYLTRNVQQYVIMHAYICCLLVWNGISCHQSTSRAFWILNLFIVSMYMSRSSTNQIDIILFILIPYSKNIDASIVVHEVELWYFQLRCNISLYYLCASDLVLVPIQCLYFIALMLLYSLP